MASLRPFFSFYGGKWRAAPMYAAPRYSTIIEPFAGSAGYAVRHATAKVVLVEIDPAVAATWRFLISATEREILRLPDLETGQTVEDLPVSQEAKVLIGWWLNGGSAQPKKSPGPWMRNTEKGKWVTSGQLYWGTRVRERIAGQLKHIRHWNLIQGTYEAAPDDEATWFIDPPYQVAGKHYRHGSKGIDYRKLGEWCMARKGQVIVCENDGATWLPFSSWRSVQASTTKNGAKRSLECIWTNDAQRLGCPS